MEVAHETEEAARVAKETVYGQISRPVLVYKVEQSKSKTNPPRASRTCLRGSGNNHFSRDSVAGVGRRTTLPTR